MSNLITLAIIVKDEADTIRRTLESALPFVDRWVIADTGSSDDTKAVIQDAARWVPGKIIDTEFVDFSTARNAVIDACGTDTKYILMLDAEDILVGGTELREWLMGSEFFVPQTDIYNLLITEGSFRWPSARVFRSGSGCRYVGLVHEVLVDASGESPRCVLDGPKIVHVRSDTSDKRTVARHVRDIDLLMRDADSNPRSAFYMARSMMTIGMNVEAARAFESRIAMGGDVGEMYSSMLCLAWMKEKLHSPWSESLELYLGAYNIAPHRAEPLYEIARYYGSVKQYALSALFSRRGIDIPAPGKGNLFVDNGVYEWKMFDMYASCAAHVFDDDLGKTCAEKAHQARPEDKRLLANLEFYKNTSR
jgi:hypothetical protein